MNLLFVGILGALFLAANLAYVGQTGPRGDAVGAASQDGPGGEIVHVKGVEPPGGGNTTAESDGSQPAPSEADGG